MPGRNHKPGCLCGWCRRPPTRFPGGKGEQLPIGSIESRKRRTDKAKELSFKSFVRPGAECPECGSKVFHFQSRYGATVVFDVMAPPWPKHACLDASLRETR